MNDRTICKQSQEDYLDCNTHICPIDGMWSPWTEWMYDNDALNIKLHSTESRNRSCSNPT
eukprot:UN19407